MAAITLNFGQMNQRKARSLVLVLLIPFLIVVGSKVVNAQDQGTSPFGLALHGGAGTILPENMTPELEEAYRAKIEEALLKGYETLREGGGSLDAVVATIQILEESPLFNAGKGAVFTNEGRNELDASIMDGSTRNAGAIAGVTNIKSPIALARLVMEASPHVMLSGTGAEQFAKQHNLETVDNAYFHTDRRKRQLERAKAREDANRSSGDARLLPEDAETENHKYGTVGVVALDKNGNLAAGTSTGGMTNKRFGRIGDSPVIGAGTYADNETCAVSATGHGEYFIRGVVAYDVAAMMRYKGVSLKEAADTVIMNRLTDLGGTGGVIAMDKQGNVAMPFNTPGMYRGSIDAAGQLSIGIYKDLD